MNISIQDFTLLSVIGKGTYAKVLLVRYKKNQQVYAMKVLKKKYIAQKKQEVHIQTQRQILVNMEHPFLMKLYFSFQDSKKLYFVLEYCPGGQLFGLLQLKNNLSEEQSKFYAAQMVVALQTLHEKNVIYRDLKPQNILIDRRGYIKLTDFGLSKIIAKNDESAMSVCGTPEYLAPQIITRQGHGKPVDWWCLGCIVFQMVTGYPPFNSQNRSQLFQQIKYSNPVLPQDITPRLQNFLKLLFEKNPKQRLGYNGAAEVKKHPWFQKINWNSLINKGIKAPFVPVLHSQIDISNFDVQFTSCEIQSYHQNESLGEEQKYFGFSYENAQQN